MMCGDLGRDFLPQRHRLIRRQQSDAANKAPPVHQGISLQIGWTTQ
jgi:hypothetical protein